MFRGRFCLSRGRCFFCLGGFAPVCSANSPHVPLRSTLPQSRGGQKSMTIFAYLSPAYRYKCFVYVLRVQTNMFRLCSLRKNQMFGLLRTQQSYPVRLEPRSVGGVRGRAGATPPKQKNTLKQETLIQLHNQTLQKCCLWQGRMNRVICPCCACVPD